MPESSLLGWPAADVMISVTIAAAASRATTRREDRSAIRRAQEANRSQQALPAAIKCELKVSLNCQPTSFEYVPGFMQTFPNALFP